MLHKCGLANFLPCIDSGVLGDNLTEKESEYLISQQSEAER